jgi:hypothetical protein
MSRSLQGRRSWYAGLVVLIAAACSSGTSSTAPPACVESQCDPGNLCLADATGLVECRLPCTAQSDCPWDYTCTQVSTTDIYCADDTAVSPTTGTPYVKAKGVWGDSCNPEGGVDNNPACDWSQGFRCLARSPTDGDAYCTQFFCQSDADCAGGWWCATVNYAPNAVSSRRSSGQTFTACQPRNYCSPCSADVDCDSSTGVREHCILGEHGTHYCAPECKDGSNCVNTDSECTNLEDTGLCPGKGATCVCAARARECTGDGLLCSPCRSDADCKDGGLCLLADYSTEHFCGARSKVPCTIQRTATGSTLIDKCPTSDEAPNGKVTPAQISCLTTADGVEDPPNQCVGLVTFGTDPDTGTPEYVLGCWTPNR